MSRMILSHQHSLKFGSIWRKVSWKNSKSQNREKPNLTWTFLAPNKSLRKMLLCIRITTSINSKPTDKTQSKGWFRIIIALPHHPRMCARKNSSNIVSYKRSWIQNSERNGACSMKKHIIREETITPNDRCERRCHT